MSKSLLLSALLATAAVAATPPAQPNPPSQPAMAEWTFLVFINADNNLDENGPDDINEMEAVGSTDQVNIVCQIDREGNSGTWRYKVQKDDDMSEVTSPVLEEMPEQDMGSADTLKEFIEWGTAKFPAKKVAVVLWNHGSGWEKQKRFGTKGISYDDDSGNHITVKQVGAVLHELAAKRGQPFEIIAYDACLMQMAEVADEVIGAANYQVASEETEPLDGWPYDGVLAGLVANPTWNGAEFGKHIVQAYADSYDGGTQGDNDTTQSVIDLGRFAEFKAAADKFTAVLQANPAHAAALTEAIEASQSYAEPDHKDMVDFIDQVTARITDQVVVDAANGLKAALTDKVVLASAITGSGLESSKGLAVWLPTWTSQSMLSRYKELNWASATQWDEFVTSITAAGGDGGEDPEEGKSARNALRAFRGTKLHTVR